MRLFQVVWDYIAGSLLTTKGDIVKRGAAVNERMAVGAEKTVLGVNDAGDDLEYREGLEILINQGDMLTRDLAGVKRLPRGAAKRVLGVNDAGLNLEYRQGIEIATVKGDLIKRGGAAAARFPVGPALSLIIVNSAGDDLVYGNVTQIWAWGISEIIKCKMLEIGNWDMPALAQKTVAHGLTLADIMSYQIVIRNDNDTARLDLTGDTNVVDGFSSIGAADVVMDRVAGRQFDNVVFDDSPYNRGFITIWHKA